MRRNCSLPRNCARESAGAHGRRHVQAMMQNLDMISVLFLFLGVAATIAVIYSFELTREWFRRGTRATNGMVRRAVVRDSSLDTHIATQWTEGRLRLDVLLALIKKLEGSLEQEVETLRQLDHSDLQYEQEAGRMVEPTLRRFTFDRYLRDECRIADPPSAVLCPGSCEISGPRHDGKIERPRRDPSCH